MVMMKMVMQMQCHELMHKKEGYSRSYSLEGRAEIGRKERDASQKNRGDDDRFSGDRFSGDDVKKGCRQHDCILLIDFETDSNIEGNQCQPLFRKFTEEFCFEGKCIHKREQYRIVNFPGFEP